jgi:hypothetical protein
MHSKILHFATAATAVALACSFGTQAISAEQHDGGGLHKRGGQTGQHTTRNVDGNSQVRHRKFNQDHDDDGDSGRRHRRHGGIGFGGVTIDLDSIDSGCRYSYRKWQATGSRYWRSRYYDCVG